MSISLLSLQKNYRRGTEILNLGAGNKKTFVGDIYLHPIFLHVCGSIPLVIAGGGTSHFAVFRRGVEQSDAIRVKWIGDVTHKKF